jgi:S1-C subfamily serine protease
MLKFLLKVFMFLLNILPYALTGFLIFLFLTTESQVIKQIKDLKAEVEEIEANQIDMYSSELQLDQALAGADIVLSDEINKVKAENTKQNSNIVRAITSIDKKSEARSQGIVDGVNQVVTDVSYALQKPSYDYLKSITVKIIAKNKDLTATEKGWMGTGVIVAIDKDYTYILTNRHVMGQYGDGTHEYYVKDGEDKYTIEALKISKDENVDLAFIRIKGNITGKRAVIGFSDVQTQDPVYMVGMDLGRPFFYSEGTVAGFDPESNDELVVGMPVGPGNSGSGVIDKDGKLVGLLYAGSIIDQEGIDEMDIAHGLCVPIKAIRLFLSGYIEE